MKMRLYVPFKATAVVLARANVSTEQSQRYGAGLIMCKVQKFEFKIVLFKMCTFHLPFGKEHWKRLTVAFKHSSRGICFKDRIWKNDSSFAVIQQGSQLVFTAMGMKALFQQTTNPFSAFSSVCPGVLRHC